jgi:DNA polymerase-1
VDSAAHDPEKELMAAIRACGGRTKGDWMVLLGTPHEKIAVKYSALDPWLTLQLHTQFVPRLRHWPQPEGYPPLWTLYRNECWLTLALRDMEERGICASREFLERWRDTLIKDVRRSLRVLNKMAGDRDINWNSAPQLREFLFNKKSHGGLGLEATAQTKSHADSTDKHALIKLNHPIGAELLNYRKLTKQLGTYAEGLLSAMHADDTIHCWFNQNVDTGRMSCSNPNLQQQTRGQGVRGAYVPREGTVFRFADYSQIEMRFAAHEAEEPTLIEGFNTEDDFDTHRATAKVMFGIDAPTDEQRGFAKTMNFATLYGAGEDRVTEGLMDRMTVVEATRNCRKLGYRPSFAESPHRALAKLLLARYRANLPAMKRATRHESDIAERRGFVMNAFGRHRYLEDEAWYTAFNTKIQGDAADQAKVGLVKVYRKLQLGSGSVALLLQVHDEIIYETDGDPAVDREVLELLAERKRFRVPIVADLKGSAVSWQDKVSIPL